MNRYNFRSEKNKQSSSSVASLNVMMKNNFSELERTERIISSVFVLQRNASRNNCSVPNRFSLCRSGRNNCSQCKPACLWSDEFFRWPDSRRKQKRERGISVVSQHFREIPFRQLVRWFWVAYLRSTRLVWSELGCIRKLLGRVVGFRS